MHVPEHHSISLWFHSKIQEPYTGQFLTVAVQKDSAQQLWQYSGTQCNKCSSISDTTIATVSVTAIQRHNLQQMWQYSAQGNLARLNKYTQLPHTDVLSNCTLRKAGMSCSCRMQLQRLVPWIQPLHDCFSTTSH